MLDVSAPRLALFFFECRDAASLRKTIDRIPEAARDRLEELVVMLDRPTPEPLSAVADLLDREGATEPTLHFHRAPREADYGAVRKEAFEYALRRGFDHIIVMRGDELHPPEKLPELIEAVVSEPRCVVIASRAGRSGTRWAAHFFASAFQNRVLGLHLRDYHSSYRAYSRAALERIPFQLDANDSLFDAEVVIQLRALGVPIKEVRALPGGRGDGTGCDDGRQLLRACGAAIGYRLHQLHFTRDGRYLVDHDISYTLKGSPTGSHMQIVDAIAEESRVLDLGCSQGLLAAPLRAKNVRVTGVDARPPDQIEKDLEAYHQRDLELPLELPTGRTFDYVVVADVIEHVRNRRQLLRSARRFLKGEGRLIISTPNVALWFYRLSLLVGRFEYGPRGVLDETHVRLYTGSTFRREVERAGFQVLRQRVTALPFEVVFESTGRSRLIRAIAAAYHRLARLWPAMFAYQFILEAQITTLDEEATS